jgi:hypothetical protein
MKGERMNSLIYAAQMYFILSFKNPMYLKISITSHTKKDVVIVKVSEDQSCLLIDVTLL